MNNPVYDRLAAAINARGTSVPAVKCREYYELVEFLFTPEEATIFCAMPIDYASVEEIGANLGRKDFTKLAEELEKMGDKGLVHIKGEPGRRQYQALPFVPGIIEFQLWRGVVDERSKKWALLLASYSKAIKREFTSPTPPTLEKSAPGRKVIVEQDVTYPSTIIPYMEMKQLIMDAENIAAGICVCRHQGNLIGKPSNEPMNNCMIIGETAEFTYERGFTKKLTREEALQRLEEAEDAGLVHCYVNSSDRFSNLLCNCCGCHCWIIKGLKKSPAPRQMVYSRYLSMIDEEACTGCEACIERCWMGALKMVDGRLVREEGRCIGCGICMRVCPTEAISLEPTSLAKVPLKR